RRSLVEVERWQGGHRESRSTRRFAGCRFDSVASGECCESRGERSTQQRNNHPASPHSWRETSCRGLRRRPLQHRNEKRLHGGLLLLRSGQVKVVRAALPGCVLLPAGKPFSAMRVQTGSGIEVRKPSGDSKSEKTI